MLTHMHMHIIVCSHSARSQSRDFPQHFREDPVRLRYCMAPRSETASCSAFRCAAASERKDRAETGPMGISQSGHNEETAEKHMGVGQNPIFFSIGMGWTWIKTIYFWVHYQAFDP